jgi:hypothetical protein
MQYFSSIKYSCHIINQVYLISMLVSDSESRTTVPSNSCTGHVRPLIWILHTHGDHGYDSNWTRIKWTWRPDSWPNENLHLHPLRKTTTFTYEINHFNPLSQTLSSSIISNTFFHALHKTEDSTTSLVKHSGATDEGWYYEYNSNSTRIQWTLEGRLTFASIH